MTDKDVLAEVERLRGEVAGLRSAVAKLAEHMLGTQFDGLLSMFPTDGSFSDWPGRPRPDLVPELTYSAPRVPSRPPEDSLPRSGRNPRIFCEQYDSGTWIHGRPHNCPAWARR